MVNSSVSLPLKLTGRHMDHVMIKDSTFATLPWPGVFLHNSSHVEIIRNLFLQTMPRSISISLGNDINISHNLLDVSEALKVEQYEHQIIKCNRPIPEARLPATCNIPIIEYDTIDESEEEVRELVLKHQNEDYDKAADSNEKSLEDEILEAIDREKDIIVTVLGTVDTFGLIWIFVTLVFCSLLMMCLCCCKRRQQKTDRTLDKKKTSAELRPDLLVIPFSGDDDEYSESSRVHLAMGPGPGDTGPWPGLRLPQYVTVQGVRAEPQEDGVVCGQLTLGPSFAGSQDRDDTSDRTVSSNILKQQAFSKV